MFLVGAVLGMAVSYQKVFLLHVAFAFIAFVLVVPQLRRKSEFHFDRQPTYLHWLPVVMFVWYSVMTLASQHVGHSLKYLFYVANGVGIVFLMVYYTENLDYQKKVFRVLAWIFSIEVFVSLLEIYTPFRMPLSPYSPYLSFFGREFETSFDLKLLERVPTGFHWNPNDLAIAMALVFPFFLLAKKIWVKVAGCVSIFLIVMADDSRACLITLFIILIVYILMYQTKILKVLIPLLIISLLFSPLYYKQFEQSKIYSKIQDSIVGLRVFITMEEIPLDSIGLRQHLIRDGIQSIIKSKGLGIGPGENMYIHKKSTGKDYYALHNFWLELCVDAGVLFGLLFMVWHWYMAFKLWRISRRTKDPDLLYYARGTFLSLVGFYFAVISASSAIYFLPMWILYGFAIITIHNGKRLGV